MRKIKNFMLGFITATLLLVSIMGVFANGVLKDITAQLSYEIKTKFNGKEINLTDTDGTELEPILYEGRTYLPIRSLSENIGVDIKWEQDTKTIQLSTNTAKPMLNEVVATINDNDDMLAGEVNIYLLLLKNQYEALYGPDIWNTAIDDQHTLKDIAKDDAFNMSKTQSVLALKAKENGIELSAEDNEALDKKAAEFMKNFNEQVAKANGIDIDVVKKVFVKEQLANQLYNKEMEDYTISEDRLAEELKNAFGYIDTKEHSYDYYAKKARAKHILFSTMDDKGTPLAEDKKEEARKEAEKVLEKAKNGEDFVSLVKEFSQDPGSKDKSGEYIFTRGQMVKEFEEAAFSMKPGEIRLIETVYGYHIIKLEEVIEPTDEDIKKLADEQQKLIEDIKNNILKVEFDKIVEKWLVDYKIDMKEEIWDMIDVTKLNI